MKMDPALQKLLSDSSLAFFIKESGGMYIAANAEFERKTGKKSGEVAGKTDLELFGSKIAEQIKGLDMDVLEGQKAEGEILLEEENFRIIEFPVNDKIGGIVCQVQGGQGNYSRQVMDAIHKAQNIFITREEKSAAFEVILEAILEISQSKGGFIAEKRKENDNTCHYLTARKLTDGNTEIINELAGLEVQTEFFEDVINGKLMINDRAKSAELSGHFSGLQPEYRMGMPLFHHGQIVGLIIIYNSGRPYTDETFGRLIPLVGLCGDLIYERSLVNTRRTIEEELRERELRLQAIYDGMADGLVIIGEDGLIDSVNPAAEKMFGYGKDELTGKNISVIMAAGRYKKGRQYEVKDSVIAGFTGENREQIARRRDSSEFPVQISYSEIIIKNERMLVGIIRDITERIEHENSLKLLNRKLEEVNRKLLELATRDELTRIANRRVFNETLDAEVRRLGRRKGVLSLLIFDVDYFKRYNDSYGHPEGDKCLKQIAEVASKIFRRNSDLVCRYGGEEFAAILPGTGKTEARHLAEKLRIAVMEQKIKHIDSGVADVVTISVGVTTTGKPFADDLLIIADRALYKAKQSGRNRVEFINGDFN